MPKWKDNLEELLGSEEYACAGGVEALAQKLGVKRLTVHRWRTEATTPNYKHQQVIAKQRSAQEKAK